MSEFSPQLIDRYNRSIEYLRLSVTDRCDFRCTYCMAEDMNFLPRKELLSLEELATLAEDFVAIGIKKIRLTGGEPLVRRNILELIRKLKAISGLETLAMTTNGSKLAELAQDLKQAGLDSLNVSLDSLNPLKFRKLTRYGELEKILEGLQAAKDAGFDRIKLNCVVLRSKNLDEVGTLVRYALAENFDISFIEEMPLGKIQEHSRLEEFVSSEELWQQLSKQFELKPLKEKTPSDGPSRYWGISDRKSRIGFISPHSDNFCASCNRIRLTCTGKLLLCLGNEDAVDLREILRSAKINRKQKSSTIRTAISQSMNIKPLKHNFELSEPVRVLRFMNATGG